MSQKYEIDGSLYPPPAYSSNPYTAAQPMIPNQIGAASIISAPFVPHPPDGQTYVMHGGKWVPLAAALALNSSVLESLVEQFLRKAHKKVSVERAAREEPTQTFEEYVKDLL